VHQLLYHKKKYSFRRESVNNKSPVPEVCALLHVATRSVIIMLKINMFIDILNDKNEQFSGVDSYLKRLTFV